MNRKCTVQLKFIILYFNMSLITKVPDAIRSSTIKQEIQETKEHEIFSNIVKNAPITIYHLITKGVTDEEM